VVFCLVKAVNSARNRLAAQKEAAPEAPAEEVVLLREIRDSLKK
jgi:large conductance mechanosensitive channel